MTLTITADEGQPLLGVEEQQERASQKKRDTALAVTIVQIFPQVGYMAFDVVQSYKLSCLNGLQDSETGQTSQINEALTNAQYMAAIVLTLVNIAPNSYGTLLAFQGGKLLGEKRLEGLAYTFGGGVLVVGASVIDVFALQPWLFNLRQDKSYLMGYENRDGYNKTETSCLAMDGLDSDRFHNVSMGIGSVPVSFALLLLLYKMLQIPKEPVINFGCLLAGGVSPIIPGMIYSALQFYTSDSNRACSDGMNRFVEGLPSRDVSSAGSNLVGGLLTTMFASPMVLGLAILYGHQAGTILSSGKDLCKALSRTFVSLAITAGSFFIGSEGVSLLRSSVNDSSYANGYKFANFTANYCDTYQDFPKDVSKAIDITVTVIPPVVVSAVIALSFLNGRRKQQNLIIEAPSPTAPAPRAKPTSTNG